MPNRHRENADYLRVELHVAAGTEMITKLEDFLRRRSKISQVVRQEDFVHTPGLQEACQILFGDEAQSKLDEYIDSRAENQPGSAECRSQAC